MSDRDRDAVAVIMAGGKGARLGALGRKVPKCLLPLSGGETLLSHLADQLGAGGIRESVVCCSTENFSTIRTYLQELQQAANPGVVEMRAVCCESCVQGPLSALAEALTHVSGTWRLACLGDICFSTEPFSALFGRLENLAKTDGCLLTGTNRRARDGAGTGMVICDGTRVRAISYRPMPTKQNWHGCRQWTGAFLFHETLLNDLNEHLAGYVQAPFESWIQGALERGASCSWIEAGEFVNTNSLADYRFLTGNLKSAPVV